MRSQGIRPARQSHRGQPLRSIRAEPLRESGHGALIRVHLAEGNQTEALREALRGSDLGVIRTSAEALAATLQPGARITDVVLYPDAAIIRREADGHRREEQAGPGALPTDAYIMGIDPVDQRRMMGEALEVILELFRSDEPVTRETDWFTIREGRLQYRPYSDPHPEVAVAAMVTPSGPRMAGQFGVSLLSLSMSVAEGFAAIGQAWGVAEEQAEKSGHTLDRRNWRVLGTMHLAETKEQAIEDCTHGLRDFANYFGGGAGFVPLANTVTESSSRRPCTSMGGSARSATTRRR